MYQTMRTLVFTIMMFIVTVGGVAAEGWKLVWSDEFDYRGLPDKTKIHVDNLTGDEKPSTNPPAVQ